MVINNGRLNGSVKYFLFIVILSLFIQRASGQDQKVADSLAMIYQADTLKGEKKMKLLSDLAFNELNDRALLLKYAEELIDLAREEKNDIYLNRGYTRQGYYHMFNGDLEKALESFFKSAEVAADANYPKGEAAAFTTIADVYSTMGNVENAELYYNKSIQLSRDMNDSIALASVLLNAGDFYFNNGQYDKALEYVEESGPIFKKFNHKTGTAYYLGNSAMIYARQGADSLALDRFNQAIAILDETEDLYPVSVYLAYMSDIYLRHNDVSDALNYAMKSLELAEDYNLREQISDANLQLSKVYEQDGYPEKALNYYKNYIIYRDSLKNIETVQQMADLRTNYEVSQKQAEVDLLNQKRKTQRNLNIAAAAGSLLFVLLTLGLFNRYNYIRRTSVKIRAQRDEIESQRDLVVIQKNEIVDSINYAQKIQSALLPAESIISGLLKEYFIFYRPRDIVSGDFYWIKQVNGQIILAAADCTGHGVPGAFMSLLGISYLNEIVQSEEITRTDQVLDQLRNKIIESLRQRGAREDAKDGMDLALCMLDQDRQILQFSGANNPLYLIRKVEGKSILVEYKADRMPIGYYQGEEKPFTNNNIRLETGDTFYLFTDGFLDQKGGEHNRKYMRKGFKDLLLELSAEPMAKQKALLEKTLTGWMGNSNQTDDILVIGVRV